MIDYNKAEKIFLECGLDYNSELHDKLKIYCDFLIEYNKNVNLTAITEPEQIWLKHFADSILLLKYVEISQNASLIDVGSGAGFPSIPVKIYRNDINITLIDSLNKRIVFLEKLCDRLDIRAKLIHGRAEDLGKMETLREQYDVVTARAVAAMPILSEYCMPFIKKNGIFAAMKGPNEDIQNVENAVKILGGNNIYAKDYLLSNGEKRRIFVVKKISHTPTKYPRNSSQIKNKSL